MDPVFQDILTASGLLALLIVSLECGFRAGRRAAADSDARGSGQVGAVQGALLGLLGLLLGFSFAAAGARFLERQDLIVAEANAIGTAYLRAELLDDPHRTELQRSLAAYTKDRIEISVNLRQALDAQAIDRIDAHHARIWDSAIAGVNARPPTMLGVLPPVNEVIDLHSTRIAASRKHLPTLVMGLLIACSTLAVGVVGYGCGTTGRRRIVLAGSLAVLIGAALWITVDLDHPRAGLLRLSDEPLKAIQFDRHQQ